MQFDRKEGEPPRALIEMARANTQGDVSARRHQASRARVLDRWTAPSRTSTVLVLSVLGTFALGTTAFGAVKAFNGSRHVAVAASASPSASDEEVAKNDEEVAKNDEEIAKKGEANEPTITVQVEPDSAKVFWDDTPMEGEPPSLTRPPDHKTHHVRAEAPGFITKTQIVIADSEAIHLELTLSPMPVMIGYVTATASIADADAVIEDLRQRFRDCYGEGLAVDPTMKGKATLTLRVREDGRVTAADIAENEGLSAKVTTCLAYVGSDAQFRETTKTGVVHVPLSFGQLTK